MKGYKEAGGATFLEFKKIEIRGKKKKQQYQSI